MAIRYEGMSIRVSEVAIFKNKIPTNFGQKYIFCFFCMTQIPTHITFLVEQILEKSESKVKCDLGHAKNINFGTIYIPGPN